MLTPDAMGPWLKFPFGFLSHGGETYVKPTYAMEGPLNRRPDCTLQPVSCPCLGSLCYSCVCLARGPHSQRRPLQLCPLSSSALAALSSTAQGFSTTSYQHLPHTWSELRFVGSRATHGVLKTMPWKDHETHHQPSLNIDQILK